jgi:hypothetical protein
MAVRSMKDKVLLTAVLSMALAGCTLRGKPKAVLPPVAPKPAVAPAPAPTPPPPLSTPQTHVELPKPQPVDPAALVVETPREPEPEPQPAAPARSRRTTPAATPAPPAAAPAPEPPRETFREMVSPAEAKRLMDQAVVRRREVNQILEQLLKRSTLTNAQKNVMATIRNFLALSDEAEKHSDPRQADSFAERAQILAKELQSEQ